MTKSKWGHLFVISGPSGVGKSSLRKLLVEKFNFVYSISATTRKPRDGEADGIDYHFMSREAFEVGLKQDIFLEWAKVYDNYYGTLKEQVFENIKRGRNVLLEIDVQGAAQIRSHSGKLGYDTHFIFISPPSMEVLEQRLMIRGTDTESALERRLNEAQREISQADQFDLVVINDEIETALMEISEFVEACIEQ